MPLSYHEITNILGQDAEYLLGFDNPKIPRHMLHTAGPDFVEQNFGQSDRPAGVIENLERMFNHGRLGSTGYLSILPVDQGIEHTAGASFAKNIQFFDPEHIVRLAIEGGCNAVASSYGVLASVAKKYADEIPFIVKINHNELLTYPNKHNQISFASVQQAADMGAVGIGATIYFGSPESNRQIIEIAEAFAEAHHLGLATIAWCYVRNEGFRTQAYNYERASDLTAQANYLAATIGADIVKQKLPTGNFGFRDLKFGKTDQRMYTELNSEHPIDLTRYQVAHGYMGRIGLINSGGGSGENDLQEAVKTAVINKRAGGMGLILGRKAFQKPFEEGVELLHAVQDVYLNEEVEIA